MASVIKHFRRKKSNADEFQITTSVSSLTVECVKEKWYPNSLSIVWDKSNPKHSSTKPVPWQPGFKNPYRGIHVWPEPDPLQARLTLFKNSKNELLYYQDRPWTILVQNVSASGRRKVIAAGNVDLADYISEEPTKYDITVTLKPMTKNIVSGSLEFTLSSVLLEDGLPRRTDKEIFDEFMKDAMEWKKKSLQKANKNSEDGSENNSKRSSEHKVPVSDTSAEEKKNDKSQFGANHKVDGPQKAASCSDNSNAGPRELNRKASSPTLSSKTSFAPPVPRPTRPSPPTQQATDASNNNKLKCDIKEVKSEKNCLSPEASPPSSERPSECVLGQEPVNQGEVKSSSSRRKRNRRKKKASKCSKWLNPFGARFNDDRDSLSSQSESHPCKKTPEKVSEVIDGPGRCKNLDQGVGKEKDTNNGDAIVPKNVKESSKNKKGNKSQCSLPDELVLKRAKPYDPVEELAVVNGEKSQTRKRGDEVYCNSPVEPVLKRTKPYVAASVEELEEDRGVESNGYRTSPELGISPSDVSTCDESRPIPAVKPFYSDKQMSNKAHSVASQLCPELSLYIKEQIYLLKEETACLEKVSAKLESEMQQAMKTKDCEEELEGLTQDWLTINKCRGELIRWKQDLEILHKQNNINECLNIIRDELRFLLEVEGWCKTDVHKANELRLLNIILSLRNTRDSIAQLD